MPDGSSTEFISTRPGRIDKAVELTYMETDDKKRMAQRILGDYPDEYAGMLEFIEQFPEVETPAQFERCGQIALQSFWRAKAAGRSARKRLPRRSPRGNTSSGSAARTWWSSRSAWSRQRRGHRVSRGGKFINYARIAVLKSAKQVK
ncbi:MAG: hypothetical protein U0744_09445 [Gemmataceae bacterium]